MLSVNGVDVLDVRQAAEYVGRTPETIRRWVWSGRVSAQRQGTRLLIARSDLDAAISGHANEERMSLREWAQTAPRAAVRTADTAASLVLEDRGDDHGR